MAERNAKPFPYHGVGCTDTLDTTETSPGAMKALTNLIPDPSTKNLWVCRPALTLLGSLGALAGGTPGRIMCSQIVGDFVYGMASVTTGANAGRDAPFAFNLLTQSFVAVTGTQDLTTLPVSQAFNGVDWVPPQSDVIGLFLMITSPGYAALANKVGWLDITSPAAPVYHTGNLAPQPFGAVPTAVKQFFGRAYYICNGTGGQPAVVASDVLAPTTRTNANQALTFGDNVPLTGLGTLQFENQLGGIVQALIVFKGVSNMYQVTGDFASTTAPLFVNSMNVETGTLSPNAVVNTPKGMLFFSPDGMRLMDQNAIISDPIGVDGAGVCIPFIYALLPTHMVAASNANFIRVTVQNGNANGNPQQEWWYVMSRGAWCGPHTCPMNLISAYKKTFICTPQFDPIGIYQSDVYQTSISTFIENGVQLTWNWQTALWPDLTDDMDVYELHDSYLYCAQDALGDPIVLTLQDQSGTVLADAATIASQKTTSVWGNFNWGFGTWGGLPNALSPANVVWDEPVQFSRASVSVTGNSGLGLEIGAFYARIQHLGYTKHT